jgi:hypothetical protein
MNTTTTGILQKGGGMVYMYAHMIGNGSPGLVGL